MTRVESSRPSYVSEKARHALDGVRRVIKIAGDKEPRTLAQEEMRNLFTKAKKLIVTYPDPEGTSSTREDAITPFCISNFPVHDDETNQQIGEEITIMGYIYPYHSLEKSLAGTPLYSLYQPTTENGDPQGDIELLDFTETVFNHNRRVPSEQTLTDLKALLNYIEDTHIARPWREQYLPTP